MRDEVLRTLALRLLGIETIAPQREYLTPQTSYSKLAKSLNYAHINGLHNFLASILIADGYMLPPEHINLLRERRKQIAKHRKTLELVDRAASDLGIEYVLIKHVGVIPYVPRDIDICVSSQEVPLLVRELELRGLDCTRFGEVEASLEGGGVFQA